MSDRPQTRAGCKQGAPVFVGPTSCRALAQHLTLRLVRDRTLAPSVAARRATARAILHVGGEDLLAFGLADTHLHLLTAASPVRAIELARRIKIALQRRLDLGGVPFEPTRLRAIEDVHHLGNVLPYVLGQPARHARGADPFFDGSSLLDLLGLRVLDGGRLGRALVALAPRLDFRALTPLLGLDLGESAAVNFEHLAASAAAAFALASLRGQAATTVRARRAAIHAANELAIGDAADLLEARVSTMREARRTTPLRADVDAVRGQLCFRTALQARPE